MSEKNNYQLNLNKTDRQTEIGTIDQKSAMLYLNVQLK